MRRGERRRDLRRRIRYRRGIRRSRSGSSPSNRTRSLRLLHLLRVRVLEGFVGVWWEKEGRWKVSCLLPLLLLSDPSKERDGKGRKSGSCGGNGIYRQRWRDVGL